MKKRYLYFIILTAVIISSLPMFRILINKRVVSVADYFPKKRMVKVFAGGFENAGFAEIVDRFSKNMVYVKQIDTGANVLMTYEVTDEHIMLVASKEYQYRVSYEEELNGESKMGRIMLKAPIKKGTKWSDSEGIYEIKSVDVDVKTPYEDFKCIEVLYSRNEFQMTRYYAKGVGLVMEDSPYGFKMLVAIDDIVDSEDENGLRRRYLGGENTD